MFLAPIILGGIFGIFIVGNLLKFLFDKFNTPTCFAFIGLILGSIKLIIKQSDFKKANIIHLICFIITFSFSIFLIALEKNYSILNICDINTQYLILSGILMSAGIVIPGLSKTVILMILGIYELYLSAISTINLNILIPIGIGILIGGSIFLFIFNIFFKYFKSYTYFAIIGFVLASIFVIYPGFCFNLEGLISIILFTICFLATLKLQ